MDWTPAYVRTAPTPLQWTGSADDLTDEWGRRRTPRAGVGVHADDMAGYCTGLLLAVVMHQWFLCFFHTLGFQASVGMLAGAELLIYAACLRLVLISISMRVLVAWFIVLGAFGALALLRGGYFDAKAARDLLIPLLFVWAGRSFGRRSERLDRVLLTVMLAVIVVGLVETAMPDLYSRFFNTLSFYISLGSVSANSAQMADQAVTLNGMRPDGIGRTILPQLLGPRRASAVFIEPVSLGNFAVILIAYAFAKPWSEWRRAVWFVGGALVLIALADSRFGLYTIGLLLLIRVLLQGRGHLLAMVFPLVAICLLLGIAAYAPGHGDNLYGRLSATGSYLLSFDESTLLGLRNYATAYGDMGYCYVISRFSLPGVMLAWAAMFAMPMHSETALRFRTSTALYVSLILCVSGTSLFALKTAGVLWFILGALSMQAADSTAHRRAKEESR
jgi:putative polymerase